MREQYRFLASSLENWFESWLAKDIKQSRQSLHDMIDHVVIYERAR